MCNARATPFTDPISHRYDLRNANGGIKTSDRDGGIEMVGVPIHSAPGEVEQGHNGVLKMKRFDIWIYT